MTSFAISQLKGRFIISHTLYIYVIEQNILLGSPDYSSTHFGGGMCQIDNHMCEKRIFEGSH